MIIYNGIFLTNSSTQALKDLLPPVHCKHFYSHITLEFKPKESLKNTKQLIKFKLDCLYENDKGQCVSIILPDDFQYKGHSRPHITLSCDNDTKPVYSNELILKTNPKRCFGDVYLEGIIEEITNRNKR